MGLVTLLDNSSTLGTVGTLSCIRNALHIPEMTSCNDKSTESPQMTCVDSSPKFQISGIFCSTTVFELQKRCYIFETKCAE